jgi:hypothetical protein
VVKRIVLGTIAVFAAWSVLGIVIHGLILGPSYAATAHLWRPPEDMSMALMNLIGIIASFIFTMFYVAVVDRKCLANGLKFGVMYGLMSGLSMGFGTYQSMPITLFIAVVWFAGTLLQGVTGGLLAGAIVK